MQFIPSFRHDGLLNAGNVVEDLFVVCVPGCRWRKFASKFVGASTVLVIFGLEFHYAQYD